MDYDDLRAKAEAALSGDDDAWLDYRLASPPQAVLALLDRVEELKAALRGTVDELSRWGWGRAADPLARARSVLGEDTE